METRARTVSMETRMNLGALNYHHLLPDVDLGNEEMS